MTPTHPSSDAVRAYVARACQSARDWPVPRLDEAHIEAAVLERVAKSSMDSLIVPRSASRGLVLSMAALAGIGCVVAVVAFNATRTPTAAREPLAHPAQAVFLDGETLAIGRSLRATNQELFVKHSGNASWRLSPHGRAHIVGTGERIVVALDEGRIDADVVPKSVPETFAIDVENVHVAVHGTVFSVQRQGAIAEVAVKRGAVRVTERRLGRTTDGHIIDVNPAEGRLLVAPASASVEMHPEIVDVRTTLDITKPSKSVPLGSARAHATAEPTTSLELTGEKAHPTTEELERLWERVAQLTDECFSLQTGTDPNVRVTFGTQIAVRVAPNGEVSIAEFNPPLPTSVSTCAEQRVSQLHATATSDGAVVSRAKMLTR